MEGKGRVDFALAVVAYHEDELGTEMFFVSEQTGEKITDHLDFYGYESF